jgi:hypothetical protein
MMRHALDDRLERAGRPPGGAAPGKACHVTPSNLGSAPPSPDDERVPLFGSWPAIYSAVVSVALVVMGLIALFARYPW